jgi:hypothetical protein
LGLLESKVKESYMRHIAILLLLCASALAQVPATAQPAQPVISLSLATGTGAGSAFQSKLIVPGAQPANRFTWTVVATGTPVSQTTNLEGSDDLIIFRDGVATATSTTFTSATANFTAKDAGKEITIVGAGAAGATLVTTISAVTNSTTITLGASASTSVTAATFRTARWFTLDSSTTTTSEMRHVVNKPVLYFRANLSAISGGTSPTITVIIMPAAQ